MTLTKRDLVIHIAEVTGLNPRRIYGIIRNEYKTVGLTTAEKLLMAIDKEDYIASGHVRVIPNPNWSFERWVNYMRERGCV